MTIVSNKSSREILAYSIEFQYDKRVYKPVANALTLIMYKITFLLFVQFLFHWIMLQKEGTQVHLTICEKHKIPILWTISGFMSCFKESGQQDMEGGFAVDRLVSPTLKFCPRSTWHL